VDAARHQRVKDVFLAVCDLGPAERAAAIERACAGDADLRASVEAMLACDTDDVLSLRDPLVGFELSPGHVLDGKFRIRALIGTGGLGEVWSAEQHAPVQREVAIKVVKLGMDTRDVLARFEAERQTLAILDHPHIARVLDAGATPAGRPYFAMELIEGPPITAFAQRAGLDVAERLELVLQLCQAVQHAHQKGVIHRDLKPSNVLVTTVDGAAFVKVIDFGIAKAMQGDREATPGATLEHQIIGTAAYMSPEQARSSRDVDTRTDVWALGVILHELLVGVTPFDATVRPTSAGQFAHLLDERPTPRPSTHLYAERQNPLVRRDELEGDLDWIVLKALEKDRERRYPSAAALADDIVRHMRHEPVVASPPSTSYRLRKFVRRNRTTTVAAALVFTALVAGIVSTTIARNAEHAARVEAVAALAEAESAGWFLGEMLGAANPNDMGRDVRVVDVLAAADDESIRKRFEDRPRAEIRVRRILGSTLRELGRFDEALVHQQRALAVSRTAYPPDHPELLAVLLGITSLYDEMARYPDSEPLHREALALYPKVHGPFSRRTLGAQCNFGLLLYDQGRAVEAEAQLRATLATMEAHLPPDDAYLLNCKQGLGTALMDQKRYADAREHIEEVFRRSEARQPERATTAAQAMGNLALIAHLEKDHARALELYDAVLERFARVYGPDHWRIGHAQDARADVLLALGRTQESRETRELAHRLYVGAFGADHPWTLAVASKLEPPAVTAPK
jgi:serine/threonine protein kinase